MFDKLEIERVHKGQSPNLFYNWADIGPSSPSTKEFHVFTEVSRLHKLTGQLCSENEPPIESCDNDGVGDDFSENRGSAETPERMRSSSVWTSVQ